MDPQTPPEQAECRFCEIMPAVLGLVAAVAIAAVSLDLLTGGRLTLLAMTFLGKGGPADDGNPGD